MKHPILYINCYCWGSGVRDKIIDRHFQIDLFSAILLGVQNRFFLPSCWEYKTTGASARFPMAELKFNFKEDNILRSNF